MYFWDIKKLKADLIEKPLTEKQTLPYLIALLFLAGLSAYVPQPDVYSWLDGLGVAITLGTTFFGIFWLFRKNHGDAGSHFVQRYLAIGWVALIRFFVFSIPFFIALGIITYALDLNTENINTTKWYDTLILIVLTIGYIWYFGKHLAEVAEKATYH
jgi:hypothetical protein